MNVHETGAHTKHMEQCPSVVAVGLACLLGLSGWAPAGWADAPPEPLLKAANVAAARSSAVETEARAQLAEAGLKLGAWHRIGPFRHQWEARVHSELGHVFPVEADFLANDGAPDLTKTHEPGYMPGDPARERAWLKQPDLRDGFFNELPRGPAPSWNETQYLYRTLTVEKSVQVRSNIYVPGFTFSHSRMLGAVHKAWLNGASIGSGNGTLNLREGVNHLVIKISNSSHQYGFAFGLLGLHGDRAPARNAPFQSRSMITSGGNEQIRLLRGGEQPFIRTSGDVQRAREREALVRKDDWFSSVVATHAAMQADGDGFRPFSVRLNGDVDPRRVRVPVGGLKRIWLTTESSNALPAWVEPVWIRDDGGREPLGPSRIAYRRHGLDNKRLVLGGGTSISIEHADVDAVDLTLLDESRFDLNGLNLNGACRVTVTDRATIEGSGETGISLRGEASVFHQLGGAVRLARLTVNGTYHLHGGTLRIDRELSISVNGGLIDFSSGGDGRLLLQKGIELARDDRLRNAVELGRFRIDGAAAAWEDFVIGEEETEGNTYRVVTARPVSGRTHPRAVFERPSVSPVTFSGEPVAFAIKPSTDSRLSFDVPPNAAALEVTVGMDEGRDNGVMVFSLLEDPDREPGAEVWDAVRAAFSEDAYIINHERRAGIWEGFFSASDPESLLKARYRADLRERAAMSEAAFAAAVPEETPPHVLSEWRTGLVRYMEAHDRLKEFRFEIEPEPYYATGAQMEEALARYPETPGAVRYKAELDALRARVEPLLNGIAGTGAPRFDAVLAMEQELDAMWRREMDRLPPIVYIHRPGYSINATGQNEMGFVEGCSIRIWDPARPHEPPRAVYENPDMGIHDLELSFDARTVFFSGHERGSPRSNSWQIYEVGIDGRGFRRITDGRFRNISPAELPNGRIMFLTDRMGGYAMCQGGQGRPMLASVQRDGTNLHIHSANVDSDNAPVVMEDGRVLFTRWDYGVDKDVWIRHGLWTMNPDGTDFKLYFGNTIIDPNGWWRGRPIPGRPEVVAVFGAHHREHSGMIGLTWPGLGKEAPRGTGFRWITRELLEVGDTGIWWNWQNPYPLNEQQFLVSGGLHDEDHQVRLYLLDRQGNWRALFETGDGRKGIFFPQPVVARERPPIIPERSQNTAWTEEDAEDRVMRTWDPGMEPARMLVQDVYQGIDAVVARGQVKHLAVMEQLPKTDNGNGWSWNYGPVVSKGAMHRKRVVGLVPVEADGSAYFEVPPLRSIYFNLLDEDGRTLMKMSADMHAQPGEMRSCVGCHEYRHGPVAPPGTGRIPLAAKKPPVRPEQPDWDTEGLMHYPTTVQPVFDRNCVDCHSGASPAAHLDLSNDKTRYFNMSYDQLTERFLVDYRMTDRQTDMDLNSPLNQGAMISRIRPYLENPQHSGRTLTRDELLRVYAWIDSEVVYYGTLRYTMWTDNDGRRRVRGEGNRDAWYGMEENHPALNRIQQVYSASCTDCHVANWGHKTRFGNEQIGFGREAGPGRSLGIGGARNLNLSHPEWSPLLQAPLDKDAGGWGLCENPDGTPVFADKNDPRYRALLESAQTLHENLYAHPRMDMRKVSDWLFPQAHGE
jgi:hypothetical protein